jgi:hypothetical protein
MLWMIAWLTSTAFACLLIPGIAVPDELMPD